MTTKIICAFLILISLGTETWGNLYVAVSRNEAYGYSNDTARDAVKICQENKGMDCTPVQDNKGNIVVYPRGQWLSIFTSSKSDWGCVSHPDKDEAIVMALKKCEELGKKCEHRETLYIK